MGWTVAEIPDLTGRTFVVTGANSGIGLCTADELAARGAAVTLAVRDEERGRQALTVVRRRSTGPVELARLDLADLASVRRFVADWRARHPEGLDVLVNNAGVMAVPRRRTADGFELQLGTNHLGHFALTGLLIDALRPDARVVTVSSMAHRYGRLDLADLQAERSYRKWRAYGQSKLANVLFGFELDRRSRAAGASLRSIVVHPGYAATNLQSAGPRMSGDRISERVAALVNAVIAQPATAGAWPTLRAATDPDVAGGTFLGPTGWFGMRGTPELQTPSPASRDLDSARRLWQVSTDLTGVSFPW